MTTNYTLDLNTGLTQVLTDGTDTYLYGLGRIGEFDGTDWTFPLADALGSVRQLTDASGAAVMAQNYAPYGDVLESYGAESSNYGFAGEWTDGTGLQYLRARYLNTGIGRFISRDTWGGDYDRPLTLNRWLYTRGNPVNYVDPSGLIDCENPRDEYEDEICYPYDFNDYSNFSSHYADFVNGDEFLYGTYGTGAKFSGRERYLIDSAMRDIANAYARAYRYNLQDDDCKLMIGTLTAPAMSAYSAFMGIHGSKMTFYTFETQDVTYWGERAGTNKIFIWSRGSLENTVFQDFYEQQNENKDLGLTINNYFIDEAYKHFIVHEMGHIFDFLFDQKPGKKVIAAGAPLRYQNDGNDTAYSPYEMNGFCGTKDTGHQFRLATQADFEGEMFADMFLGWVYDCWEPGRAGGLSSLGFERSNFMNEYMAIWIQGKLGRW